MFNLGPEKILVILAIALVVLGPDKLPEAARKAGQVLGHLRRLSGGFENEIRQALDEPLRAFQRELTVGEQRAATIEAPALVPGEEGTGGTEVRPGAWFGEPTSTAPVDARVTLDRQDGHDDGHDRADDTGGTDLVAAAGPSADAGDSDGTPAAGEEPGCTNATAGEDALPSVTAVGTSASPPLPSWVFGRSGDDGSGPGFH